MKANALFNKPYSSGVSSGEKVESAQMIGNDQPKPGESHIDLVTMAQAMRAAVVADDTNEVHRLLDDIRHGLIDHMAAIHIRLRDTEDVVAILIRQGQRRLLRLVESVIATVGEDPRLCSCIVRSVEIEDGLRRQAALEARLSR